MCDSCGCGDTELVPVEVHDRILADNDHRAQHNREHFDRSGVFAINLMGSPGSGKTALLEATARAFGDRYQLAAVSGDLATDNDATRLRAAGIPSGTITTGSACHLDARMIHNALHDLPMKDVDFFFIENVGNLVCPAIYDLGQHLNVVALSVTEGDDKPLKYPVMFRRADLVVLTKTDLLPVLPEVSVLGISEALAKVMPRPRLLPLSSRSGEGLEAWLSELTRQRPKSVAAADLQGANPG